MERQTGRKLITAVQVVLAVLIAVGLAWVAYKVIGYNQAQRIYQEIERAYAADPVDGDPTSIEFAALQESYPGAVGWLKMDDVDISYPIMQAQDNEYYLHFGPDNEANIDGSVFMDYRNHSFADLHVLLYGHNMLDESMFGQLDEYLNEAFYQQGTDAFTVFTPEASYRYRIFAVNVVDETDDIYQTGYRDPAVFDAFVQQVKSNSLYDTGVPASGTDHVLTLSTCSANDRLVLSAKRVQD